MEGTTEMFLDGAGWVLIVGTAMAYVAQIYPIVRKRSSEGVNPWTGALTVLSGVLLSVNVLVAQYAAGEGGADPPGEVVPFIQVFVSVPIAFLMLVCIGWFAPTRTWIVACSVCGAASVMAMLGFVALAVVAPGHIALGAYILGILAAAVTAVIWLPQIFTLARSREIGELSFLFLLFEAVGAFLVLIYQTLEFGLASGWTSWLAGLVQLVELLFLLLLYIWVRVQTRRALQPEPEAIEFIPESDIEMDDMLAKTEKQE